MKKTATSLLSAFVLCVWFGSCTPEECKVAFNLADLVFTEKNLQLIDTSATSNDYLIIHTVLNSAEDILCNKDKKECNSVADAGANTFELEVFFDSTTATPSDWGMAIDSFASDVQTLAACKDASVNDLLSFLQDGYYLVRATIDVFQEVPERDENNNSEETGAGGKRSIGNPILIQVNRGLRTTKHANGKPVYVQRIKSEVIYH